MTPSYTDDDEQERQFEFDWDRESLPDYLKPFLTDDAARGPAPAPPAAAPGPPAPAAPRPPGASASAGPAGGPIPSWLQGAQPGAAEPAAGAWSPFAPSAPPAPQGATPVPTQPDAALEFPEVQPFDFEALAREEEEFGLDSDQQPGWIAAAPEAGSAGVGPPLGPAEVAGLPEWLRPLREAPVRSRSASPLSTAYLEAGESYQFDAPAPRDNPPEDITQTPDSFDLDAIQPFDFGALGGDVAGGVSQAAAPAPEFNIGARQSFAFGAPDAPARPADPRERGALPAFPPPGRASAPPAPATGADEDAFIDFLSAAAAGGQPAGAPPAPALGNPRGPLPDPQADEFDFTPFSFDPAALENLSPTPRGGAGHGDSGPPPFLGNLGLTGGLPVDLPPDFEDLPDLQPFTFDDLDEAGSAPRGATGEPERGRRTSDARPGGPVLPASFEQDDAQAAEDVRSFSWRRRGAPAESAAPASAVPEESTSIFAKARKRKVELEQALRRESGQADTPPAPSAPSAPDEAADFGAWDSGEDEAAAVAPTPPAGRDQGFTVEDAPEAATPVEDLGSAAATLPPAVESAREEQPAEEVASGVAEGELLWSIPITSPGPAEPAPAPAAAGDEEFDLGDVQPFDFHALDLTSEERSYLMGEPLPEEGLEATDLAPSAPEAWGETELPPAPGEPAEGAALQPAAQEATEEAAAQPPAEAPGGPEQYGQNEEPFAPSDAEEEPAFSFTAPPAPYAAESGAEAPAAGGSDLGEQMPEAAGEVAAAPEPAAATAGPAPVPPAPLRATSSAPAVPPGAEHPPSEIEYPPGSIDALEQHVETNPQDFAARLALAIGYEQREDVPRALQQYKQIVKGRDIPAPLLEIVVGNLRDLVEAQSDNAALHRLLGDAYMKQGHYQMAISQYNWLLNQKSS